MLTPLQGPTQLAPDEEVKRLQFDFTGEWLPDLHPLKIGNGNFSDCQNMRYTKTGLVGVNGYTKINTNAISTYTHGRVGFQLRTPNTQKSYLFTQQWNATLDASVLATHKGTPPSTGEFESTLRVDATGAGQGSFAEAPNNDLIYCNGVETLIYGGDESAIGAFVLATSITALTPVAPIIYTDELRNTLTTSGNIVAVVAASNCYLIGSTRPLSGFTPYILVANGSAATPVIKEWSGTAWVTLTVTSDLSSVGGRTHAVTGMISFASTVNTSKPSFIVDQLLYWYQVTLTAGTCTIYHITVNCPIQNLIDLWDGVNRICIQCEVNRSSIYEDYTAEVYDTSTIQYPIAAKFSGITSTDHVVLMFQDRITAIKFAFIAGLINTLNSTLTIYYWNGSTWVSVGTLYDGTLNTGATVAMNQNGTVYWNPPANASEHKINLFSTYGYAYKLVWNGGLSAHTKHNLEGLAKKTIEGLTKAAACVVTWVGHGLATNDKITMHDITQTDWAVLNSVEYVITKIDQDQFSIPVNTTAYTANYDPTVDPGTICVTLMAGASLTQANICTVTFANHGLSTNDKVKFEGITQATWTLLNTDSHTITVIDSDSFTVKVDSTGFTGFYNPVTDSGTISVVSGNILDGCYPDTIYGIPAIKTMNAYKFAFNYKNRVFLAGFVAGKEGNGIDYGVTETSDSYNGADSSANNKRLYVGKGSSDVLAAANVFNRFGASLYNSELVLKQTETFLLDGNDPTTYTISQLSENIGIAAPRTLCTAEVAFEVTKDAIRNIALWISHVGPVIFDAAVIVPLMGINLYFDNTLPTCVNFDSIQNAHGWFDPNYYEWNICLPSGSGQVECNVWLTYHLINKKWSKINTSTKLIPQSTFKVVDDHGQVYFYGLIDSGHMVRLEHGTLWDSIDPIEGFVITNSCIPSTSIFDEVLLRNIKLLVEGNGTYDINYTRNDFEIQGWGIESGDLRIYGELVEDVSNILSYWDGENFYCKELIEGVTLTEGTWQDSNGVVSIIGSVYDGWYMKIVTAAGDFITAGFLPKLMVLTSDFNNVGPFACTSVTINTMVFQQGKASSFQVGPTLTLSAMFVSVEYFEKGSSISAPILFNKIQLLGEFTKFMGSYTYTGMQHKFKFSFYSGALSNNIKPLAWGMQYLLERPET